MRLVILDSPDAVASWAATYVKKRIRAFNPTPERPFVLGLPTGSSPLLVYKKLVELHKRGELSFANVVTFNMDEYVGIPRDHAQSYHSYMWSHLFRHVDVQPGNVHLLDGNAADLQAECDAYEAKIAAVGGVELFLGGIGPDGHIAFNEPGSSLSSRTRVKTLAYDTILANSRFFGNDISAVPKMALTVGVGTVMDAREVVVLITGAHKAYALYKCIEEGVSHMWTVSALQMHPRACIVADEDATLELRVKTVRYFKGIQETQETLLRKPLEGYTGAGGGGGGRGNSSMGGFGVAGGAGGGGGLAADPATASAVFGAAGSGSDSGLPPPSASPLVTLPHGVPGGTSYAPDGMPIPSGVAR